MLESTYDSTILPRPNREFTRKPTVGPVGFFVFRPRSYISVYSITINNPTGDEARRGNELMQLALSLQECQRATNFYHLHR